MPDNDSRLILANRLTLDRLAQHLYHLRSDNQALRAQIAELEAEVARLRDGLRQVEYANSLVRAAVETWRAKAVDLTLIGDRELTQEEIEYGKALAKKLGMVEEQGG